MIEDFLKQEKDREYLQILDMVFKKISSSGNLRLDVLV